MIRSFIVVLLLAVFFLSGTLYGMDRGEGAEKNEALSSLKTSDDQQDNLETTAATTELEEMEKIEKLRAEEMNEPEHFTVKTASFLETAVKGFYEVVVEILYQISSLFF
ncbi:hypothetical protein JOC34_000268 [Virgibacillus halotolerans]|uniref:hypothetical protein n=1 Tax=Virgibacillus halotolerans TaxID=1071053 RepID=UPI0019620EFC|nr:hypothetical protein [Virgibacillus halotolerans]MBM7597911.1 hypothetical protein [Virgibacillus halotolerans]